MINTNNNNHSNFFVVTKTWVPGKKVCSSSSIDQKVCIQAVPVSKNTVTTWLDTDLLVNTLLQNKPPGAHE